MSMLYIYFRWLIFKCERTTHEILICLSFCFGFLLGLMFFSIALFDLESPCWQPSVWKPSWDNQEVWTAVL